jgi:replicative superfamily II helicase
VLAALTGTAVTAGTERNASGTDGGRGGVANKQIVDLDSYKFEQGSRLQARKGRTMVPKGTERRTYPTHEEIRLPEQPQYAGDIQRVPLTSFAAWAIPTFPPSVKALNPMQSQVFPAAYHTDENLLICAPTGAGKTNVAMTTILRELAKWRDEERDAFHYDLFKMVYIAPMKALVQEVVRTFGERLSPLGVTVAELSGDQNLSKTQLEAVQLIVTTPEKWDIVTRKGMDRGAAASVRLIIIDEIHLLHSERGPVLESIVARTRRATLKGTVPPVRLVGLSATLPNYEDVAVFLGVDKAKGLFYFNASFRPVPLKQTFCGILRSKAATRTVSTINEVTHGYAMGFARQQQQVLVFVHGRKDTIATADFIRRSAAKEGLADALRGNGAAALQQAAQEAQHRQLRELLPFGVGFHNAGLSRDDRKLVEELFLNRQLLVLVSTSTLAWGVNLPAHAVIIKGTKVYSAQAGGWEDLSPLDVFQMFGRAGRPGFDTFGEAVIITQREDLEYYLSLLNQQLPVESQLFSRLVDALNAEVVLGTVATVDDAVDWLESTYLHVRMLKAPKLYGVTIEEARRDPTLRSHRENLVHTALTMLKTRELVQYDPRWEQVLSTELGRIASHFYLTEASIATYSRLLKGDVDDIDLFRIFSLSSEFERISTRADERAEIRRLLEQCPIPVRDPVDKGCTKINVLLQAYISGLSLEGFALMSELVYVKDSALRIAKALHEIALCRGLAGTARRLLIFYNQILRRQWAVMSPLRQFGPAHVPGPLIAAMEKKPIDWEAYYFFDVDKGQFSEFSPSRIEDQELLFQYVHRVPRFDFATVAVQSLTRSKVRVELILVPDFEYIEDLHGPTVEVHVSIEDNDGVRLLHREPLLVSRDALRSQRPIAVTAVLRVPDPKPTHYFARASAVSWLGSETSSAIDLISVPLPALAAAPTVPRGDVIDLMALGDGFLDSFFDEQLSEFNRVQSTVFEALYHERGSAFVGIPHGAGASVAKELFLLRQIRDAMEGPAHATAGHANTVVYLHPDPLVCDRRAATWRRKIQNFDVLVRTNMASRVRVISLLDPGQATSVEENADTLRRETKANSGVNSICIVTATVAAWHEIQLRPKEHADLLSCVTAVIADGLEWLGEIAVQPTETPKPPALLPSHRSSVGMAYESVLARLILDSRERAKQQRTTASAGSSNKNNAVPRDPLHLLLASTPTFQAPDLAAWAKVPEGRCFNFSPSCREFPSVSVEVSNSAVRGTDFAGTVERTLRLLEDPKYLVARVGVVVSSAKRAVDVACLVSKVLRETPLRPYPGVEDPRLARIMANGVAYLDDATSTADTKALLNRLLRPETTPQGLCVPPKYLQAVGADDGAPPLAHQLTVFFTPGVAGLFPPHAFDFVIIMSPEFAINTSSPHGKLATAGSTVEYSTPLFNTLVSKASQNAVVLCPNGRAPHWSSAVAEMIPTLPGVQQQSHVHLAPYLLDVNDDKAHTTGSDEPADMVDKVTAVVNSISDQLLDEVNHWVAEGRVRGMDHLMKAFGTRFLAQAVKLNPGAYGLRNAELEERIAFFSQLAETVVLKLQALHCVRYSEQDAAVEPLVFGLSAARHAVPCVALKPLLSMRERAGIADVIKAIAASPHIHELAPHLPNDEGSVHRLASSGPAGTHRFAGMLTTAPVKDSTAKAVALMTAFMGRAPQFCTSGTMVSVGVHPDVEAPAAAADAAPAVDLAAREALPPYQRANVIQARRVVAAAARMCAAAVDVFARLAWPLARTTMALSQLLAQAAVDGDHLLLQLPHMTDSRVALAQKLAPTLASPDQIPELDETVRERLFEGLTADRVGDIAVWCNALPVVDSHISLTLVDVGEDKNAAAIITCKLDFLLPEEEDSTEMRSKQGQLPFAVTPYWVRPTRPVRWWLALVSSKAGDDGSQHDTLRGLKLLFPTLGSEVVKLRVALSAAEQEAITRGTGVVDATGLKALVVSDTYRVQIDAPLETGKQ